MSEKIEVIFDNINIIAKVCHNEDFLKYIKAYQLLQELKDTLGEEYIYNFESSDDYIIEKLRTICGRLL